MGNNPDWREIKQWLIFLETKSKEREKYLKAYFVYGNSKAYNKSSREKELAKIGQELKLQNIALTFVPSFTDAESEINLNNISQTTGNTFILYKRSRIIEKFINLKAIDKNFRLLTLSLDKSINEYFDLVKPGS